MNLPTQFIRATYGCIYYYNMIPNLSSTLWTECNNSNWRYKNVRTDVFNPMGMRTKRAIDIYPNLFGNRIIAYDSCTFVTLWTQEFLYEGNIVIADDVISLGKNIIDLRSGVLLLKCESRIKAIGGSADDYLVYY